MSNRSARWSVRLTVAATSAVLLTTLAATPAHADRWTGRDARGDAPAAIDIARMSTNNADRAVVSRIRFVDLKRSRLGAVWVTLDTGRRFGEGYIAEVRWRPRLERFTAKLFRIVVDSDAPRERVRCRGLDFAFTARSAPVDGIRVTVPHRCLDGDGEVLRARGTTFNRSGSRSDMVPRDFSPRLFRG